MVGLHLITAHFVFVASVAYDLVLFAQWKRTVLSVLQHEFGIFVFHLDLSVCCESSSPRSRPI